MSVARVRLVLLGLLPVVPVLLSSACAQYADAQAMMKAVQSNQADKVVALLARDSALANLQLQSGPSGFSISSEGYATATPLHAATDAGHVDMVRLLLDRGANVGAKLRNGQTALHAAASKGRADLIALLLDRGAQVNAPDRTRATPLHHAVQGYSSDVPGHVTVLIERGAAVDARDEEGRTPLHHAAMSPPVAAALCAAGADPTARDRAGKTAAESGPPVERAGLCRVARFGRRLPRPRRCARPRRGRRRSPAAGQRQALRVPKGRVRLVRFGRVRVRRGQGRDRRQTARGRAVPKGLRRRTRDGLLEPRHLLPGRRRRAGGRGSSGGAVPHGVRGWERERVQRAGLSARERKRRRPRRGPGGGLLPEELQSRWPLRLLPPGALVRSRARRAGGIPRRRKRSARRPARRGTPTRAAHGNARSSYRAASAKNRLMRDSPSFRTSGLFA